MKVRGFQYTGNTISLVIDYRPISIDRSHKGFEEVLAIVTAAMANGTLETDPSVGHAIEQVLLKYEVTARKLAMFSTSVEIVDDKVLVAGEELTGFLAERLVDIVDQAEAAGTDPVALALPLARFAERLMRHPWNSMAAGYHERAMFQSLKADLYRFLEKGKMPLTGDGCFLAYKAIDSEFYSIHSGDLRGTSGTFVKLDEGEVDCTNTELKSGFGKIRNQVGDAPRIPLNMVNPDRDQTCSYGLHVCSFDYLPRFSHANGHVMLCKVAPEDVGSIPGDYNDTKMRVCAYTVVDEYPEYYTGERANWGAVCEEYDECDECDEYGWWTSTMTMMGITTPKATACRTRMSLSVRT